MDREKFALLYKAEAGRGGRPCLHQVSQCLFNAHVFSIGLPDEVSQSERMQWFGSEFGDCRL